MAPAREDCRLGCRRFRRSSQERCPATAALLTIRTGDFGMKRFVVSVVLACAAALSLATSPSQARPPAPGTDIPSSAGAKISSTPAEAPQPACPSGMVEVDGEYCPVVEQFCVRHVDPKHPERDRCAEFAPTGRCLGAHGPQALLHRPLRVAQPGRREARRRAGLERGARAVHRRRASASAATGVDARLRGSGAPAVSVRLRRATPEACNIDKPYIMPDDDKWANPRTRPEGGRPPRPARPERFRASRASAPTASTT